MRLFQNAGLYPRYLARLDLLDRGTTTFDQRLATFLRDRYGACHLLLPVDEAHESAFFTNGDDERLQTRWAAEQGMPRQSSLAGILLAQIEHHRTEVFYNLDPMRYGKDFLRQLPGCVKHTIAWRAAPSAGADLGGFDLLVCNFPSILRSYEEQGWRAAWLAPSHDPQMDEYASRTDRPIDVLFVGGYTRHHRHRAAVLEKVAALRGAATIRFCLDRSRSTRLAESALGRLLPLAGHRRPADIRAVTSEPVFGRELYEAMSQARIVLNGSVDMAGNDRGNMRCFEAMGCGALMVSNSGLYPPDMEPGRTMLTYETPEDAARVISQALARSEECVRIARAGHAAMANTYSKARQWEAFQEAVAKL